MGNPLTDQLTESVNECINNYAGDVEISPASVALCAYGLLDPEGVSPQVVQWGCNLELRALARAVLRKNFDPVDADEPRQHQLFPDLQERYPTKRNGGPKYVLLDHLSMEEGFYNVERLRNEGNKKIAHGDSLEEYLIMKYGDEQDTA